MAASTIAPPLAPETITLLQQRLLPHGQDHELSSGEVLDPVLARDCVGFVLCGQLRLTWEQGEDVTGITVLRIGDWLNADGLLVHQSPPAAVYRATAFTRLMLIEIAALRTKLGGALSDLRAPLNEALAVYLAQRTLALSARLHQSYFADTEALVIEALEEATTWPSAMSHPDGTLVKIPCKTLAERVGCTRVTASRVLGKLMREGRMRREGRRILLSHHWKCA